MTKRAKSKIPKVDPYIDGLMAKLLERLVSIEKKMDRLLQPQTIQVPQAQAPRRDRVLYEAICADCSKVCEVPFKPSEDRAVYCKECWARRKGGVSNRPGMPILRPVALPPKPASKLSAAAQAAALAKDAPKKAKKSAPVKKAKKKK